MTVPGGSKGFVSGRRLVAWTLPVALAMAMSPMAATAQDVVLSGPDPAIEGIDWRIDGVEDATLRLDGGVALVEDTCGSARVAYTLEPDIVGLRFDAVAESSLCVDAAETVDRLARVDGYEILGDGARFVDAGARPVVDLSAVEAATSPAGTWRATGFDAFASGVLDPPLTDSVLTVSFGRDGALQGTSACGEYIGAYEFDADIDSDTDGGRDGGEVDIGIRTTGVSDCSDERRTEEFGFTSALQAATTWMVSDIGIDLLDADGIIRVRLMQDDRADLVGEWAVLRFVGANGVADTPVDGSSMTIRFDADGRVEGDSGCRPFLGGALFDGDTVIIGVVGPLGQQCRRPLRRQERRLFAALDAAVSWSHGGADAELRDGDGRPVVELLALDAN